MSLEASPLLPWVFRDGQSPSEDKEEIHPQNGAPPLYFVVLSPALGQPYEPFWLLCPLGRSLLRARGCSGHSDPCSGPGAPAAKLLQPPQTSQFVQALCLELSNTEPPGSNVHSANLLLH